MWKIIKRFLPIKIFHIYYGYGWWWGEMFFFFQKKLVPFIVVPMCMEFRRTTFVEGREIINGIKSWDRNFWK